jgi:hypothetical protein
VTVTTDQPHFQEFVQWQSGRCRSSGLMDGLAGGGSEEKQLVHQPVVLVGISSSRATPLEHHVEKAYAAVAELIRRERQIEIEKNHQRALQWLKEHRHIYSGRWVALDGADLLAAGETAREVYDCVKGNQPPALIVKVEADDLPFAGW